MLEFGACKRTRKNEVICCSAAQVQMSDAVTQLSLGYVSNSLRNTAQISKQKKTFGHFNLYFLILTNTYAAKKNIYYKVVRPQSKMLNSFVTSHEVTMLYV